VDISQRGEIKISRGICTGLGGNVMWIGVLANVICTSATWVVQEILQSSELDIYDIDHNITQEGVKKPAHIPHDTPSAA
jgi:hypothetical protein